MTREEAYALIEGLTREEKLKLFAMLLSLRQNPEPAEAPEESGEEAD